MVSIVTPATLGQCPAPSISSPCRSGILPDLSPRARDVLGAAAVVAAEDTRHFATLARHHGLAPRALSYHDHNEVERTGALLERLRAGDDVAIVSDAGTPLISDPGYRLVRAASTRASA